MNILIVDDQPHLRFLYRMEFEIDGYEVCEAASGEEALEILSKRKIDGVVMELSLPDMNGLMLMNEILTLRRNVPIIVNTGYPRFREDIHSWGADAFVTKSSDLRTLKSAVIRHVGTTKNFTRELVYV